MKRHVRLDWLSAKWVASKRDIPVDKEHRSRYYSLTISARFKVISTHKTSGAHLDTSHNCSGRQRRVSSARVPACNNIRNHETESYPDSDERKQVSPSRVTLL